MRSSELVDHYPRLYHMAEAGSWTSIERHGLLSTSALLDLYEVDGDRRNSIESVHRPESVRISHPEHGTGVVRDQKPMRDSALEACLEGMTLNEWYRLLNGYVFFWLTETRLETLLGARAYKGREHDVLVIDTARLLANHEERVHLSPINSGSTLYNPPRRGVGTFLPISEYPFEERRRIRGVGNAIAELAVLYSVPDVRDFVVRVERRRADHLIARLR